jgi:hypothetical protein
MRIALACVLALVAVPALAYTQEQLDWAHNLTSPGTGWRCSDMQDAELTQQDIAPGQDGANHWFARIDDKWVEVPDENVIKSGNAFREPIVWYSQSGQTIWVRCFVAGALY